MLDQVAVETILLDELILKTNATPLAPQRLRLLGLNCSQNEHHLDRHPQGILDVGLVPPGGPDGRSPFNVLWRRFDKEEEENIFPDAFIGVVHKVLEVAEHSGLLSGDGEALVDVGEPVDQVAIGIGFDVADDAVVQLLPADHHHRQHKAGGHHLHQLAFSNTAEIQKHPGMGSTSGCGPCLRGGGSGAGVGAFRGGKVMEVDSVV